MNILGLVVWSVAMGVAVSQMGGNGRILCSFFDAFADATMKLVTVVIWLVMPLNMDQINE
jgi:solute carrier family 1 (high affinity glutamate transporter) protein 1/solute carrier family 1 (high affinity glutamate transporter) protein 3